MVATDARPGAGFRRALGRVREAAAVPGPFPPAPAGSGLKTVPGDAGWPVLGHTLASVRDPLAWGRSRLARHGPVSWSCGFGRRLVSLVGPEAAEVVLRNRDRAFAAGPAWDYFLGPFFRGGLLSLDFEEHLRQRRIVQQAFTPARLRGYLDQVNRTVAEGLDRWRPAPRFPVAPAVKRLTLDLAARVLLGARLGREAEAVTRAFSAMTRAVTSFVRVGVPGTPWARGLAGRRVLERFCAERLPAKRAGGDEDLFGMLCHARADDGDRFTDTQVVDHVIGMLLAAHDTTTVALNCVLYQLAKHPDWQERVRAESRSLGRPLVAWDDLGALVSAELVEKEAMRLVAPVPVYPRWTVRDTDVLGHHLPRGTLVVLTPHVTHHLADRWPDPERFDPERFAGHRREDRVHRYAWLPFGGGAHKCAGAQFADMNVKALLHQLLLRFRIGVAPDYETRFDFSALPTPVDGLPVRLERLP
ncbi:cytochrome P450 [Saccharothrix syringae]|uniref:Cytochrome P450 n=1 Tax=Saccharothrix syringae TaxID=103733 RepID=A0A5Q0HEB4_SACSY|nr:cytochrome P450 [Saccharothrix syringae]QFZ24626.1 cytochrome P450 [Saccharothrix syringae]